MKQITYQDPLKLNLPKSIIDSLNDNFELAHIRKIGEDVYVIISYPIENHILRPICLKISRDDIELYHDEKLIVPNIDIKLTFTDFITMTLNQYQQLTDAINDELEDFENVMDDGIKKSDIQRFFKLSKQLIYYQSAINAIAEIINYIVGEKVELLMINDDLSDYVNIKIEVNQLNQNIDMYQKVIASIISVSDSLFSNKLNKTMKTLTSVTLVLAIPTFITSFYGMNIDLPFQNHPNSLMIVFIISFVLTSLSVIYFYRKDYFWSKILLCIYKL